MSPLKLLTLWIGATPYYLKRVFERLFNRSGGESTAMLGGMYAAGTLMFLLLLNVQTAMFVFRLDDAYENAYQAGRRFWPVLFPILFLLKIVCDRLGATVKEAAERDLNVDTWARRGRLAFLIYLLLSVATLVPALLAAKERLRLRRDSSSSLTIHQRTRIELAQANPALNPPGLRPAG